MSDSETLERDLQAAPLELTCDRHVLRPRGELDVVAAPALRACLVDLMASPTATVVLDLSAVTFVDSTILGVIAGALRRSRNGGGGTLSIRNASGSVWRVFELTGLDRLLVDQ